MYLRSPTIALPPLGAKGEPPRGLAPQVGVADAIHPNRSREALLEQQAEQVVLGGPDHEAVLIELGLAGATLLGVARGNEGRARDPRVGLGEEGALARFSARSAEVPGLADAEEDELEVVATPLPDGAKALQRGAGAVVKAHPCVHGDVCDATVTAVRLWEDERVRVAGEEVAGRRVSTAENR
jgi:hypothetical protein